MMAVGGLYIHVSLQLLSSPCSSVHGEGSTKVADVDG